MVGSASGTSRSMVNFLRPVTASMASTRLCGLPTTSNELVGARLTSTALVVELAAAPDSSAYVRLLPSGAVTTPPLATSEATVAPSAVAAASRSAPLATAAATRIGVNIDCIVFDPPVSWLKTSSGRAGASVTRTSSTGTASSSAMIIAAAVVIPCPTSMRGMAKCATPSASTVIVMSCDVGSAAWVCMSPRS